LSAKIYLVIRGSLYSASIKQVCGNKFNLMELCKQASNPYKGRSLLLKGSEYNK